MPDAIYPQPRSSTADDRFDILRAARDLFLRRLTEIVRQSGIGMPAMLEAFTREVGEAYDQLASSNPSSDFDETADLTASRLTLMGDDELDLDIRIRDIGNALRQSGGRETQRCQLAYRAMLGRPQMSEASSPIGAEAICSGLWAICRCYGGDLEQRLALLERIELGLRQHLTEVYRLLGELLMQHGIEPLATPRPTNVPRASGAPEDPAPPPTNALSTLQRRMQQRFESPSSLAPTAGDDGGEASNSTLDAAAMVMLNHLLERLTALEVRTAAGSPESVARDGAPSLPPRALTAKDFDLPLGRPEAVTLDTMALIFEVIFDSEELPDAVKAAIGRLQIPLLKLAILDPSLFADRQHPARVLVNRLARAAVGLPRSSGWEHPVCRQIGKLTAAVRGILDKPKAVLDAHLAEIEKLISARDRAVRSAAEGLIQRLVAHEKAYVAERIARAWLSSHLARTQSPEIAAFLERYWSRVMVAAAIDGGTQGSRWQQDNTTGEELIWSVQPKQTTEERKRLAGIASSLLKRIGAGLDQIGVSAGERAPFLNALFAQQTAALRGQAVTPTEIRSSKRSSEATNLVASRETIVLEADGRRVQYPSLAQPADPSETTTGIHGQVGDWLRFLSPNDEPFCGLCCWHSETSDNFLFFNPDRDCALILSSDAIAHRLAAGEAQVVSQVALFDAAAESALRRFDPH